MVVGVVVTIPLSYYLGEVLLGLGVVMADMPEEVGVLGDDRGLLGVKLDGLHIHMEGPSHGVSGRMFMIIRLPGCGMLHWSRRAVLCIISTFLPWHNSIRPCQSLCGHDGGKRHSCPSLAGRQADAHPSIHRQAAHQPPTEFNGWSQQATSHLPHPDL